MTPGRRRSLRPADDEQRIANRATRAELATRIFVVVLLLGVTVGVVTILLVRDTQVDRLPQAEQNDETLAIIKDCTQPAGRCYKRSQRATAQAVGDISRVIVLAAACAVDVSPTQSVQRRQAAISACITKQLAGSPNP